MAADLRKLVETCERNGTGEPWTSAARAALDERDRLRAELEAARAVREALPAYMHTRTEPTEVDWYAMTDEQRAQWEHDREHSAPRLLAALDRYDATRQGELAAAKVLGVETEEVET